MDKDNSEFDFDNDPDFTENFYKNIAKAIENTDAATQEPEKAEANVADEIKAPEDAAADNREKAEASEADGITAENKEAAQEDSEAPEKNQVSEEIGASEKSEVPVKETESSEETGEEAHGEAVEEELTGINEALAKQISEELEQESIEFQKIQKKKRFWKIQSGVMLALLCLVGFAFFLGFTKPGTAVLMKLGVNISGTLWSSMTNKFGDSTDVVEDIDYLDEDDLNSDAPELDPSTIVWPDHPGEGRQEAGVYNILLLGEEQIGMGDGRGRTDVIVIATLNTNNKTVKLTSLMRDMLVQIPGYQDNKLNTAYEKGGLDLLYETIALNFDLRLDGCVMVNFENFEKIVDALGGLEITLKKNEADYLNSTNYISDPANRNVVAGTQLMNGNQVLGYARVRKTSTITGNNNDYGRTDRHRMVLNAIYEKCKTKSKTELLSLMVKFLPMITTDINSKCFQAMLNSYIDMGMSTTNIEQLRIPADGTFQDNIRVRGMSVLIPDLDANIELLHNFIFGDDTTTNTVQPTGTAGN